MRFVEITGKMGFIFIGVLFASPDLEAYVFIRSSQLYILCLFLGLSIYSLNSYFGYDNDLSNQRLSTIESYSKRGFRNSSICFTIITLLILCFFDWEVSVTAGLMILIWGIYASPNIGLKSIPILGLVVAFIAQLLHFHLGYLVFASVSVFSMVISIYFALLFAAGHALHEVIDYEADKEAKLNTSAVYFGRQVLDYTSLFIFAAAAIYWTVIYHYHVINFVTWICYFAAFLLQLIAWVLYNKSQQFVYRRLYMVFYFVATIIIILNSYWL